MEYGSTRGIPAFDPEPILHTLFEAHEAPEDPARETARDVFRQQLDWARERVEKGYCGRDL